MYTSLNMDKSKRVGKKNNSRYIYCCNNRQFWGAIWSKRKRLDQFNGTVLEDVLLFVRAKVATVQLSTSQSGVVFDWQNTVSRTNPFNVRKFSQGRQRSSNILRQKIPLGLLINCTKRHVYHNPTLLFTQLHWPPTTFTMPFKGNPVL